MATTGVLKTKPTQKNLDSISSKAGDNWRSLLTQLGEEQATIVGFLQDKSGKTSEACFKGLVHWWEGNADKPVTWETLLKALREANLTGYAEDLEKGLEAPSQDDSSEQVSLLNTAPERNQLDGEDQNIEGQGSNLATAPDVTTFDERSIKIKRIVQKYKKGGEVRLPRNPDLEKKYDGILWSVKSSLSSATPKMIEKAHYFVCKMYERLYDGMTAAPPEVAKTSDALCKFIDTLSSPYEVFLIERAVDGVSDEGLKKALCNYKLELCKYLEEKLFSSQSRKVTLPQRTDHTHMAIVISEEQALLSLVLHLKEYFVEYIGLQQCLFEGFQEGCSVFYFAITADDAVFLAPKILSHLAELKRRFSVTHIVVFSHFVLDVDNGSVELLANVDEAALSRSRVDLKRSEAALKEEQMKSEQLKHQVIATRNKLALKHQQLVEADREKVTFKKLKDELERQKIEEKVKIHEMEVLPLEKTVSTLQSRIGELTTLLEEKEEKIAGWKESAERMEIRYSEHEGQRSLVVDKQTQTDQDVNLIINVSIEVQQVHEVLKRNRGYLEMTIPMDVIITTLEAQDVLLPYELHQVKSHASLIEKNRSFLDSLMMKSPDMFYTFCSIMEGLPGYKYIGRYLRAEMKDVHPTVLFDEKRETIPKAVDALVDKELLEKSIQSIVDKQREMAEEVRKVHQTEVSHLKKAVSDARDKVSDVKEECNKIFKQMDEEKSGSSEQLVTLQGRIAEIVKVCEDVQIQQKEDDRSTQENIIAAMKLQRRIGELTTLLEVKEQEIAAWKGSAERMEIRYSELEGQRSLVVDKLEQRDQELAESKVRYDSQRERYEKMMEKKRKEIEDLERRYAELEGQRSLVVDKLEQRDQELAESKVRYDSQREKYEKMKMIENMRKEIEDLQKNRYYTELEGHIGTKRPGIG